MPPRRSARAQNEETEEEADARIEKEIEDDWRRSPWEVSMAKFRPNAVEKNFKTPAADQWVIRLKSKFCLAHLTLSKKLTDWLVSEGVSLEEQDVLPRYTVYWNSSDPFFVNDYKSQKLCESWVIQAWGEMEPRRCKRCIIDTKDDEMPNGYLECRTIDLVFEGCCGNCKRDEKGKQCDHNSTLKALKKAAAEKYEGQHYDNSFDKEPRFQAGGGGKRGWGSDPDADNYLP